MAEQLFKTPFHYYSQQVFEEVRKRAQHLNIASVADEQSAIADLIADYRLEELEIDWGKLMALPTHKEEESFHPDVFGDQRRVVTPVYTFEAPYKGSPDLLRVSPSSSRLIHVEASISPSKFTFEIRGADKSRLEQIKEGIQFNIANQKHEVASYNSQLEQAASQAVSRRKQELGNHDDGLNAFGVPIKSEDD